MALASLEPGERARKNENTILQRLAHNGTQAAVATAMGHSESTISRMKDGQIKQASRLMAHLGLKVVPVEFTCVDSEKLAHVMWLASEQAKRMSITDLLWDEAE